FKDMNKSITEQEEEMGVRWTGRAVADRTERKRFAKLIISDLEHLLSPHHKNILTSKLGFDSQTRLERGMKQGCRTIAAKLSAKYGNHWTRGMLERYNLYNAV